MKVNSAFAPLKEHGPAASSTDSVLGTLQEIMQQSGFVNLEADPRPFVKRVRVSQPPNQEYFIGLESRQEDTGPVVVMKVLKSRVGGEDIHFDPDQTGFIIGGERL